MKVDDIRRRIDQISKEQIKLEKTISKLEEDDIFDDSLYKEIETLENEKTELENQLNQIA